MSGGGDNWYAAILQGIGAPVTAANLAVLRAWHAAEGGSYANNPFNTTYPSGGVKNYPTQAAGIDATIKTLTQRYYTNLVAALRRGNDPIGAITALVNSPWAAGHYLAKKTSSGAYNPITSSVYRVYASATPVTASTTPNTQLPPQGTVWVDTNGQVLDSTGKIYGSRAIWIQDMGGSVNASRFRQILKPGIIKKFLSAKGAGLDPGAVTPIAFPVPNPVDTLAGNDNSLLSPNNISPLSAFGNTTSWFNDNMSRIGLALLGVLVIVLAVVWANKGTIISAAKTSATLAV